MRSDPSVQPSSGCFIQAHPVLYEMLNKQDSNRSVEAQNSSASCDLSFQRSTGGLCVCGGTHLSESDQRLQLASGDGRGISRMSLSSQRQVEVLQGLSCFSREGGAHVLTSVADVLPQQAGWDQVH